MQASLLKFATILGLPLTEIQAAQLIALAQCVWMKKDFLNLTSASSLEEILARHICDGLTAAAKLRALMKDGAELADMGAGCGYIGLTLALCLPEMHVTLVESLQRRCKFMNWATLQLGIKNVTIKQTRLGQGTQFAFDAVTERAMGALPDIAGICMDAVKPGGYFLAFQGEHPQATQVHCSGAVLVEQRPYNLPCDTHPRHLVLFRKKHGS